MLSKFTGVAIELGYALPGSHNDIQGIAEAAHHGLEMSLGERRVRMRRLRRQVLEHNVYPWAPSALGDLRELRL